MKEVMRGDVESMSEKSFITMVTNALTNHGASPLVSEHIACLLSLPFVAPGVTKSELAVILSVSKLITSEMIGSTTRRVGISLVLICIRRTFVWILLRQ